MYEAQGASTWPEEFRELEKQLGRDAVVLLPIEVHLGYVPRVSPAAVLTPMIFAFVPAEEMRLESIYLVTDTTVERQTTSSCWTFTPYYLDANRVLRAAGDAKSTKDLKLTAHKPLVWTPSQSLEKGGGVAMKLAPTGTPAGIGYVSLACTIRRGANR